MRSFSSFLRTRGQNRAKLLGITSSSNSRDLTKSDSQLDLPVLCQQDRVKTIWKDHALPLAAPAWRRPNWDLGTVGSPKMSVAPLQFLLLVFAGWVSRRQLEIVEFLQEDSWHRTPAITHQPPSAKAASHTRRPPAYTASQPGEAYGGTALGRIVTVRPPATINVEEWLDLAELVGPQSGRRVSRYRSPPAHAAAVPWIDGAW